jgi:hypothetical protein
MYSARKVPTLLSPLGKDPSRVNPYSSYLKEIAAPVQETKINASGNSMH